ncbi:MAG: beta-galactosidase [Theionarchaea archaeon]|nr:beta-galactosidase [Theionarchaea archaeon]
MSDDGTFNRLIGVMYPLQGISETGMRGELESKVRDDMAKIRRMGYNTVYLFDIHRDPEFGATYSPLWYREDAVEEMKPLSFDPEDRDEFEGAYGSVFGAALSEGMRVIPSVCYNLPLQWLWENRDALKRKSDGSPHYTVYYHECFRNEKVLHYTRERLRQFMTIYAGDGTFRKSLALLRVKGDDVVLNDSGRPLFVIHNDTIDRGFCYCGTCKEAWVGEFLPRIYGDVGSFNEIHGTGYSSFDEIPMPSDKTDVRLWYELSSFFAEGLMTWVREVGDTIRECIPDAMLSLVLKYPRSQYALQYPDWTRICELCDLIFMDPYPMEGGNSWNICGYAFDLETYRSISLLMDKPLIPQFQLSSSYSEIDMVPVKTPTEREVLQQFYVAIGRGARGFISWAFPPALADESGRILDEERAIKAANRILKEARQLFAASEGTREAYGQVMLPYNYPSLIRDEGEFDELFSLFSLLSALGVEANPTYMNLLGRNFTCYDAIIGFNSLMYTSKRHASELIHWIEKGGQALCGNGSLKRDEVGEELPPKLKVLSAGIGRFDFEGATGMDDPRLHSRLVEFVRGLPAWPIRVTCSGGSVISSHRHGDGVTIIFLVNNHPRETRVFIELDHDLAPEGSTVYDVITGGGLNGQISGGKFRVVVDLDPFESKALSAKIG